MRTLSAAFLIYPFGIRLWSSVTNEVTGGQDAGWLISPDIEQEILNLDSRNNNYAARFSMIWENLTSFY
mgnify:FL=1|jgi:hypothetical protein